MIDTAVLRKILSRNVNGSVIDGLVKTINKYNISENEKRIAMFLAQVIHESGGFKFKKENLSMSAERICKIWPKRFSTIESAQEFAFNPEKLANKVYSNRMGNGPEDSGDGFKYIGRGFIQLTGKSNYQNFADSHNMSLDEVISYLETDEGACESAGWFWNLRGLNPYADMEDIITVTKRINGGLIGLEERTHLYKSIKNKILLG